MGKIASRIFNDGLSMDPDVKKRLQEMQDLSGGIYDSVNATDAQLNKDKHNFGGTGYLSGKTPFVRMWTAVRVSSETETSTEITIDDGISDYEFDFINNSYEFPQVVEPTQYSGATIKETKLEKYPANAFKVYQLGMNKTSERNIFSPQQDDAETTTLGKTILPSQKNKYTDESYIGNRKNLQPPAGITGLVSTTQNSSGPVAGILTTTVNFTVYDFEEFDSIYSRYFMRPAAKVFVDFGYSDDKTFQLYDPQEYIADPKTFNEKVYGKVEYDGDGNKKILRGQLQESNYGMNFIQGQVVSFNSDLDPSTGAYKCSVKISSKATQIIDVDINEDIIGNIKKSLLSNIEFRILDLAQKTLFPNFGKTLIPQNLDEQDIGDYEAITNLFGSEILSDNNKYRNTPTELSTKLGIYWKGSYVKDPDDETKKIPKTGEDALYLSYGFIEDVIINGELAKYPKAAEQFNDGDAIEFDSSKSYTRFSQELTDRQRFLKSTTKLPFLFPNTWTNTYNTRKGKRPDPFNTARNRTGDDVKKKRIPLREIFIKLSLVKRAIKSADSVSEMFNYIFKEVAESTGYLWNWGIDTADLTGDRIGVVDRNYISKEIVVNDTLIPETTGEEFFNDMFRFEPFSPTTIVKSMTFGLSPGDGSAISSKLALQSLGSAGRNVFASSEIIDQTQIQMQIEDIPPGETTYKSKYSVEYYPPSEGGSDLEKIFAVFESTAELTQTDPNFLASENIYGGDFGSFDIPKQATQHYKNATQDLLDAEGDEGDIEPSVKPTIEYRKHKAVLENQNYEFCDNVYDYFTKRHLAFTLKSKPTILPMKLNLKIHGFTGLQPSDKFKINHIPSRYTNFVFFQIMRITHTISPGIFNTELDCVPRMRDDVKEQLVLNNEKKSVLTPSYLKNTHKCKGVEAVLPFLSYMKPDISMMDKFIMHENKVRKNDTYLGPKIHAVDAVYRVRTLPTGVGKSKYVRGFLPKTFTLDEDETDDTAEGFVYELFLQQVVTGELQSGKVEGLDYKRYVSDGVQSYKTRYTFEGDTEYYIIVSDNRFFIAPIDLCKPRAIINLFLYSNFPEGEEDE